MKKVSPEQRKQDIELIVKGTYPEEEFAVLGENRGQLFVRIPKMVQQRLKLKKGQQLKFRVEAEKPGQHVLHVEVALNEEA